MELSNRLETIPREILFEIIDRLNLRDTIRVVTTLKPCEITADYVCACAHRREFAPTLAEITAIKYSIRINDYVDYPPAGSVVSRRDYRGVVTKYAYYNYLYKLESYSDRLWPVKLIPNRRVVSNIYNRVYERAYTFDFEKGNYHLLRLIEVLEYTMDGSHRVSFSIFDFKSNTVNGKHVKYVKKS